MYYLTPEKKTKHKRLQTPNLETKYEVKVKFQVFNPHPVFYVAKIEHKTNPAPIEIVHIDLERGRNLPSLTKCKIIFTTQTLALNTQLLFRLYAFIYITKVLLHSFMLTFTTTIPITPTNTEI